MEEGWRTQNEKRNKRGREGRSGEIQHLSRVGFRFSFRVTFPPSWTSSHVRAPSSLSFSSSSFSFFPFLLSSSLFIDSFSRFVSLDLSSYSFLAFLCKSHCERETLRTQHASNETFRLCWNENRKWQSGIFN